MVHRTHLCSVERLLVIASLGLSGLSNERCQFAQTFIGFIPPSAQRSFHVANETRFEAKRLKHIPWKKAWVTHGRDQLYSTRWLTFWSVSTARNDAVATNSCTGIHRSRPKNSTTEDCRAVFMVHNEIAFGPPKSGIPRPHMWSMAKFSANLLPKSHGSLLHRGFREHVDCPQLPPCHWPTCSFNGWTLH